MTDPVAEIYYATRRSDWTLLAHLIRSGIDPSVSLDNGNQLLHDAQILNQAEVTQLLIAAGADVNAVGHRGSRPLHMAAAMCPREEVIRELVETGADVNAVDNAGWTPLHAGAQRSSYESLRILIEHGANVNACDFGGQTPLHIAAAGFGLPACCRLLVEAGADVLARDEEGRTPLDVSRENLKTEEIQLYLATAERKMRADNSLAGRSTEDAKGPSL